MDDTFRLIEALPAPVAILDDTGRVSFANAPALALLGDWIVGRSFVTVLRQPDLLSRIEAAARMGQKGEARYRQSVAGVETDYTVTVDRWARTDGAPWVVLHFENTSHLSEAALQRRDFVANVSHELKTPLTAVMGFIDTLRGPAKGDGAAADRFLEMMAREAGRMNRLITDLLSLSRVEASARTRPAGGADLVEVIGMSLALLQDRAEDAGLTLVQRGPDTAPMQGDPDQLGQVVTNLVENAIKYGGGRDVTIDLQALARDARVRGPAWRLSVHDQGAGIDPVHLPRLTERFYRVDGHRDRSEGGTGLGLAIVKHIVQRHGGYLTVRSAPREGSTFAVTLPCGAQGGAQGGAENPAQTGQMS